MAIGLKAGTELFNAGLGALPGARSLLSQAPSQASLPHSVNLPGGTGWSGGGAPGLSTGALDRGNTVAGDYSMKHWLGAPTANDHWGAPVNNATTEALGNTWRGGSPTPVDEFATRQSRVQAMRASPFSAKAADSLPIPRNARALGDNLRVRGPSVAAAPSIDMPKPSGPAFMPGAGRTTAPQSTGPTPGQKAVTPNSGFGGFSVGRMAMYGAAGAGLGGGISYATGGEWGQGAKAGLMMGTMGYGAARFAGTGMGKSVAAKLGQMGPEGFGPRMQQTMAGFENAAHRRAAFGGGALLGGMMFGGDRSHRRGFNRSRGNTINR